MAYQDIRARVDAAARRAGHAATLVAVSKTKPVAAIRAMAALGQRAFGENYIQEAVAKQGELRDLALEWHMIGPLQSNKCREVSERFDWLQTLDREKLVPALHRYRPAGSPPLNVLIQVNIDAESSKSGCAPEAVQTLAENIAGHSGLKLRGLMAIPEPHADGARRGDAFRAMRQLYSGLQAAFAGIDTLSMGMSEDFELAIEEGATMVRIGTALFGARQ